MKKLFYLFSVSLLLLMSCDAPDLIRPSDDLETLPIMDVFIAQESYVYLLRNRANNAEVKCKINYKGKLVEALIRGSGAGSRYYPKWSYKVTLDDDFIEGYDEFNLSAQVSDPTLLATAIATDMYKRLGFPVFRTHFVFLRINGEDQGLYPLIERVEEEFFAEREMPLSVLFKVGYESNFSLKNNYNPAFQFEKKFPRNQNFNYLLEFLNAVDTSSVEKLESSLGKFLYVENYMKYHAMTVLLNNTDAFSNNFFLHKTEPSAPFKVIPWDFDKAFFPDYSVNSIYAYNALIDKIKESEETHKKYLDEFEYQMNNIFTLENIKNVADSVSLITKEAYNLDPYLGKGGRYNFEEEKEKLLKRVIDRKALLLELLNKARSENNF